MLSDHSRQPRLMDSSITRVTFGDRVKIVNPVNLYKCDLGDDVFIGPFTEIQAGVRVGNRTRVQSHSFICSLVNIGEDVFIGHGVVFINDKLSTGPARGDVSKWQETQIGNRVSIGSNSTILPVRVADDVVIGAGSVVTKDLLKPGVYAGNPAKWLRAIY